MHALELKIPPVAVVGAFAAAMWLLAIVSPALQISLPSRHVLALILMAGGAGVALSGIVSFAQAQTTINPLQPAAATALVESGVFRFTRNPMYLGMLGILLGWAAFLASLLAVLLLPGFVLYMTRFQIVPEERALTARFGAAFAGYAKKVRRWL